MNAAFSVISKNTTHPILKLWTKKKEGEPLYLYEARNEKDEAEFILRAIKKLSGERIKNLKAEFFNLDSNKPIDLQDLISIIQDDNSNYIRKVCIEFIKILDLRDDKLLEVLKSLLTSEENPLIRSAAIEVLYQNFEKKSKKLLSLSVNNDNSVIVLKKLTDLFLLNKNQNFDRS